MRARLNSALACALGVFAIAACGGEKKQASTPATPAQTKEAAPIRRVSPAVGVSEDLARACKLHMSDATNAPKFDFDKSELLPSDRAVLEQIAACLTTGPLKGQAITLVGRADPRGEPQYNMALGAHRANGVADYLTHLGLDRKRAGVTSRGELDAVGVDEASWQGDRRVDITLAQ